MWLILLIQCECELCVTLSWENSEYMHLFDSFLLFMEKVAELLGGRSLAAWRALWSAAAPEQRF